MKGVALTLAILASSITMVASLPAHAAGDRLRPFDIVDGSYIESVSPAVARDLENVTVRLVGYGLTVIDDVSVTVGDVPAFVRDITEIDADTNTWDITFEMPASWMWGWGESGGLLDDEELVDGLDFPMSYNDLVAELADLLRVNVEVTVFDAGSETFPISYAPPAMLNNGLIRVGGCGDWDGVEGFVGAASVLTSGALAGLYSNIDGTWWGSTYQNYSWEDCRVNLDAWPDGEVPVLPYESNPVNGDVGVYNSTSAGNMFVSVGQGDYEGFETDSTVGWNGNQFFVSEHSADADYGFSNTYGVDGNPLYDETFLWNSHLNYDDFIVDDIQDGAAIGHGTLHVTTIAEFSEKDGHLEISHDYTLAQSSYQVDVQTSIVAVDADFENVNIMVGTYDNWVRDLFNTDDCTGDCPLMRKGNFDTSGFAPLDARGVGTAVIEVPAEDYDPTDERFAFTMMWSEASDADAIVHDGCCEPYELHQVARDLWDVEVQNDGMIALLLPFGDIADGGTSTSTWHVGAGGSVAYSSLVYGDSNSPSGPDACEKCATRLEGLNRYDTSAAVSQRFFAQGSETVIIASGNDFPDALVAGPVASTRGPLLLVASTSVPESIEIELRRLDPDQVIVIGGSAAISDQVVDHIARVTNAAVTRIGGLDRLDTARMVSHTFFEPGVPNVFLATSTNFPDALAGSAASRGNAPVLLLGPGGVTPALRDELVRIAPDAVTILGGTSVVPSTIDDELNDLLGAPVTRLGGNDRYHTAALVSEAFNPVGADLLLLATGSDFADALVAAGLRQSLLLVHGQCLDHPVDDELRRLAPDRVQIIGGYAAVSRELRQLERC